jgi:hypothetical protein
MTMVPMTGSGVTRRAVIENGDYAALIRPYTLWATGRMIRSGNCQAFRDRMCNGSVGADKVVR